MQPLRLAAGRVQKLAVLITLDYVTDMWKDKASNWLSHSKVKYANKIFLTFCFLIWGKGRFRFSPFEQDIHALTTKQNASVDFVIFKLVIYFTIRDAYE